MRRDRVRKIMKIAHSFNLTAFSSSPAPNYIQAFVKKYKNVRRKGHQLTLQHPPLQLLEEQELVVMRAAATVRGSSQDMHWNRSTRPEPDDPTFELSLDPPLVPLALAIEAANKRRKIREAIMDVGIC